MYYFMNMFVIFILFFAVACGSDSESDNEKNNPQEDGDAETCEEGSHHCPCYGNETCDEGLVCLDDICVTRSDDDDDDDSTDGDSDDDDGSTDGDSDDNDDDSTDGDSDDDDDDSTDGDSDDDDDDSTDGDSDDDDELWATCLHSVNYTQEACDRTSGVCDPNQDYSVSGDASPCCEDPDCGCNEDSSLCLHGACEQDGTCDAWCKDGEDPDCEGLEGWPCLSNENCTDTYRCHPNSFECTEPDGCTEDADCSGDAQWQWICNDDAFCLPKPCRVNADCGDGRVCQGGVCHQAATDCSRVERMTIEARGLILTSGVEKHLSVGAWDSDGKKIVFSESSSIFAWSIEHDAKDLVNRATITEDGIITGGTETGAFRVKASCVGDTSKSSSLMGYNLGSVSDGNVRVVVVDEDSLLPVESTTVCIEDVPTCGTTDLHGASVFENRTCMEQACNIHVFGAGTGYNMVSVMGVKSNNIIVHLKKNEDYTKSGGFKIPFSWEDIPQAYENDLRFGFAGTSSSSLLGYQMALQTGEDYLSQNIELVSIQGSLALPPGLEIWIDEDQINRHDATSIDGRPGTHSIWGFGGFMNLGTIMNIVSESMTGGDIDLDYIMAGVLAEMEDFHHGLAIDLDFQAVDKIQDTGDENDNGSTDDLISDFNSFPAVPTEDGFFHFVQPMDQSITMQYSGLQDGMQSLAAVVGAFRPDFGFVQLGYGYGLSSTDGDEPNHLNARFALQHGGIDGYPYIVLTYVNYGESYLGDWISDGLSTDRSLGYYNTVVMVDTFPDGPPSGDYVSAGALEPFGSVTATPDSDELAFESDSRATFVRATYHAEGLTWVVYYPSGTQDISIDRPAGMPDAFTYEDGELVAARLMGSAGDIDFDSLFTFNGANISDINDLLKGYVIFDID